VLKIKKSIGELGLRTSENKTEYLEYDFGGQDKEVDKTRIAMKISG